MPSATFQRREFLKLTGVAVSGGIISSYGFALETIDHLSGFSIATTNTKPVVMIDGGCPVIDYSGTGKAYEPPEFVGDYQWGVE